MAVEFRLETALAQRDESDAAIAELLCAWPELRRGFSTQTQQNALQRALNALSSHRKELP